MIRVTRPDLQLRLLTSFLQFLGLPVLDTTSSSSSSSDLLRSLLLDDLSLLQDQRDRERPLTSVCPLSSLSSSLQAGVSPVGRMTVLGEPRKQAGLCKAGEEFVQNVLHQVAPLLPAEDRAVLHLSWLQYEKLKVSAARRDVLTLTPPPPLLLLLGLISASYPAVLQLHVWRP